MKHRSFLYGLVRSYLVIAVIPLLLVLTIVFINTVNGTKRAAQEELHAAASLISSQLNSLVDNMSFISISLISNTKIISAAKGLVYHSNTLLKEQEYYSELKSEFCTYAIAASPYNVIYFNQGGYYITSEAYNVDYNYRFRLPEENVQKITWLDQVQDNYGQSVLLPVQTLAMPLDDKETLTLVRSVRDPGKIVGYLGVQVDSGYLDELFTMADAVNAQVMMLAEDGDKLIYATQDFPMEYVNDSEGENRASNLQKLEEKYLVSYSADHENGIVLVLTASKQAVLLDALKSAGFLTAEALVLLVLTVLLIIWYARKLTRPLIDLTLHMEETTLDNLNRNEPSSLRQYEEIEKLYYGYGQMRSRLKGMIHNEIISKTLQMQERMNSLQSQIHPHFLYNTLNVIGIMGMDCGSSKVYQACFKLSSILRYSIAEKNRPDSRIQEEMENAKAYLELMGLRYEHRFQYRIRCSEAVDPIRIPRLTVQPFLENIFEHAYSAEHATVNVEVTGYVRDGRWYLVIEDDGKGMEQKEIEQFNRDIRQCRERASLFEGDTGSYGMGIQNTILRLFLYFGDDFSYSIEAGLKAGIRVELSAADREGYNG